MSSWMRLFLGSETAMAVRATVIIGPSAFAPIPFLRSSGGVTSAINTVFQTAGAAGPHVADIENRVREVLVEEARLDVRRELRLIQLAENVGALLVGVRRQPQRSQARQQQSRSRRTAGPERSPSGWKRRRRASR